MVTLVPRTCLVRQELALWGQQHAPLPRFMEKPGRTQGDEPRRGRGQSGERSVEVEYAEGQIAQETLRFLVGPSTQLAEPQAKAYAIAQAQEAARVADHIRRVAARSLAGAADAEAAIAQEAGRGQGRRGRRPKRWR